MYCEEFVQLFLGNASVAQIYLDIERLGQELIEAAAAYQKKREESEIQDREDVRKFSR